jgi:hypothetical protein
LLGTFAMDLSRSTEKGIEGVGAYKLALVHKGNWEISPGDSIPVFELTQL